MVPPSPRFPHAVLGLTDPRDGCLRFPVRSGSHTRFMSTTEVETSFLDKQNRHAQRELRHDQLLDAIEEQKGFSPVRSSGPTPAKPALAIALVPHAPGAVPWDRSAFERYQRQLRTETTLLEEPHTTFDEVEPVADGFVTRQDPGSTRQVIPVFADDGSAGVAYPLSPRTDRAWYGDDDEVAGSPRPLTLSTGELTEVVAMGGAAARHKQRQRVEHGAGTKVTAMAITRRTANTSRSPASVPYPRCPLPSTEMPHVLIEPRAGGGTECRKARACGAGWPGGGAGWPMVRTGVRAHAGHGR